MADSDLPLILEPDELERRLGRPGLLVVDLGAASTHARQHVPGAVHLDYARIVAPRPPVGGLLPDDRRIGEVLSSIGMTARSHVIAYDDEGGAKACRLLWTLDVIGHRGFSLLNGGLQAWVGEGHRTESGVAAPARGDYRVTGRTEAAVDAAYVLAHLDDPSVVVLDTRSPAEFSGADRRAARGGHIPGAVNLEWTLAVDRTRNLRLRPDAELRALFAALGVTPDKEVVTHCQTHHRSSHTYIALRALGYPRVRAYAGSWSEWGNDPSLPIEA